MITQGKKLMILITLLLVICTRIGWAEEQPLSLFTDYAVNGSETVGVGVEKVTSGYQLRYYEWNHGQLQSDQEIHFSPNLLYRPQIAIDQGRMVVTFLEERTRGMYLRTLINTSGTWSSGNYGLSLNPVIEDIELVEQCISGNNLYIGYLQRDVLTFVLVDLTTGIAHEILHDDVSSYRPQNLTMTELDGKLVFAYTFRSGETNVLRLERVIRPEQTDWHQFFHPINGYDILAWDHQLYLTFEVVEPTGNRVVWLEFTGRGEIGTFVRNDSSPNALKLAVVDEKPAIFYRDYGVNDQFDLYLTKYDPNMEPIPERGWLTWTEILTEESPVLYLNNIRENLDQVGENHFLLHAEDQIRNEKGVLQAQILDASRRMPLDWRGLGTPTGQSVAMNPATSTVFKNIKLRNPGSMALDSDGNLYVLDGNKVWIAHQISGQVTSFQLQDEQNQEYTDFVLDHTGDLHIVDARNAEIWHYTNTGVVVNRMQGGFHRPVSIARDNNGIFYVLDQADSKVHLFSSHWEPMTSWGSKGVLPHQLLDPSAIAVSENCVYIADTGNHQVKVFESSGIYIDSTPGWGNLPGYFAEPVDVDIIQGSLFVADRGNHRVQVLNSGLGYLYEFGQEGANWGEFNQINRVLAFSHDRCFVTDGKNQTLQFLDQRGIVLLACRGGEALQPHSALESVSLAQGTYLIWNKHTQTLLQYDATLQNSREIKLQDRQRHLFTAFTADQRLLYFTDALNHTVNVYDFQGQKIHTFAGPIDAPLWNPQGIAVDHRGTIAVADTGNHRIAIFDSSGNLTQLIGRFGTAPDLWIEPESVTYSGSTLLVSDRAQARVQMFDEQGTRTFAGFGFAEGELAYSEYLYYDLSDPSANAWMGYGQYPQPFLNDDPIPAKSKVWNIEENWGYQYRYCFDLTNTTVPDGEFTDLACLSLGGGTGTYYLHLQAGQELIEGIPLHANEPWSSSFILDNTSPVVQMPVSSILPRMKPDLHWTGVDNIDSPENLMQYRYTIAEKPYSEWSSTEIAAWNALPFTATQSTPLPAADGNYYLTVQARDRAGNESTIYTSYFRQGDAVPQLPQTPPVVREQSIQGWLAHVTYVGDVVTDVELELLPDLNFRFHEQGETVTRIPLTRFEGDVDGLRAGNPDLRFAIDLSGKTFSGQGITLDASGFQLNSLIFATPEEYWYNSQGVVAEENKKFVFQNVRLSLATMKVDGVFRFEPTDCYSIQNWTYRIDAVILDAYALRLDAKLKLPYGAEAFFVPLSEVNLNTDFLITSATLPPNTALRLLGDTELTIQNSYFTPQKLIIYKAALPYQDSSGEHQVLLRDFAYYPTGEIVPLETFSTETLTYRYQDLLFQFAENSIQFIDNQLFALHGGAVLMPVGQVFPVTEFLLANLRSPMVVGQPVLDSVATEIHGFPVTGYDGIPAEEGIHFTYGLIDLLFADDGGNQQVLELSLLPYTYSGTIDIPQIQIVSSLSYHNLADLHITEIIPENGSLRCNGTAVLDGDLPTGFRNQTRTIQQLWISPTEGITELTLAVGSEPLTLVNAYEFSADTVYFTADAYGKSLYLTGGTVRFIGEMANILGNLESELYRLEIDDAGNVVILDTDLGNYSVDLLGMQVELHTDTITDDSLTFSGEVLLPTSLPGGLSGLSLRISQLSFNPNTGKIKAFSLYPGNGAQIPIGNWNFELYHMNITGDLFRITAALQMPATGRIAEMLPQYAGKYIRINNFTIHSSGEIVSFLLDFPLQLSFDLMEGITVKTQGLQVSMQGGNIENLALLFKHSSITMPEEIGGGELSVTNLRVNAEGDVSFDQIQLANTEIDFKNVAVIHLNSVTFNTQTLNLHGTITLGEVFPEGLKNRTFLINRLEVNSGGIVHFEVGVEVIEPIILFDAVKFSAQQFTFSDTGLKVVNGTIHFVNGLGELTNAKEIALNRFEVNYSGKIVHLDAEVSDFAFSLLDCSVHASSLYFTDDNVSFTGSVILSDQLPGQLKNMQVDIQKFTVEYSGDIINCEVGTSEGLSFMLNDAEILFTSIAINSEGFRFDASLQIPDTEAFPTPLRGLTVGVSELYINRNFQIDTFEAELEQRIEFPISAVDCVITYAKFSDQSILMTGELILPETFPGNLGGNAIAISNLELNYQGQWIGGSVTLAALPFTLGSYFTGTIQNFGVAVVDNQISLTATRFDLHVDSPVNSDLIFTNIVLRVDGHFSATVQPGFSKDIPIAGCTLRIINPFFNRDGVTVGSAELVLPEILGSGAITLSDVSISPDHGLEIGGGGLSIQFPDMSVGGVGLKNASMGLVIANQQFAFEGQATAQIPGIGEIEALIKLRTRSDLYPSGIERIYLSFMAAGLGLPLGTTGLYINGVYGEFADGPVPDGAPQVVQQIGGGMRFNLGIYLRDMTALLRGSAGFWVNITNYNTAITGEVEILGDLVKVDAFAAITNHFSDFYAEANIAILGGVIEGNAGFHIWNTDRTYLTGWCRVSFKLKRGAIIDRRWIKIPRKTRKIGGLGAEFGDFRNNVRGVKGYIMDLPIVGQIGFFAGNIGIRIGGVSKYVLMSKGECQFVTIPYTSKDEPTVEFIKSQRGNFVIGEKEYLTFVLPGKVSSPIVNKSSEENLKAHFVPTTERLVFIIGSEEGDLELMAIAPDGSKHLPSSKGVELVKEENQIALAISKPLPGEWKLEITGGAAIDYEVAVLGITPKPELEFSAPTVQRENGNTSYLISGIGGVFTGKQTYIDLYFDTNDQKFDGRIIAERVPVENGKFAYAWDTTKVPNGTYHIYGKLYDDGDLPPVVVYAPGTVQIENILPLRSPTTIYATATGREILVQWEPVDNPNIVGYKVYYTDGEIKVVDAGMQTSTRLPMLDTTTNITVTAYDQIGEADPWAEAIVDYAMPMNLTIRELQLPEHLPILIGGGQEVTVPFTADYPPAQITNDYFMVRFENVPDGVSIQTEKKLYRLYRDTEIRMLITAEANDVYVTKLISDGSKGGAAKILSQALPGEGEITMIITNVGPFTGTSSVILEKPVHYVMEYDAPSVTGLDPQVVHDIEETPIEIMGGNFRPNAVAYLGTTPLQTVVVSPNLIRATVPASPAGTYVVKVENPDGKSAKAVDTVEVLKTDFAIHVFNNQIDILPGNTAHIYLTVEDINDFAHTVTIEPVSVPQGLSLAPVSQQISVGEVTQFAVTADFTAPSGFYTIRCKAYYGSLVHYFDLIVKVGGTSSTPAVLGMDRPYAIASEPVHLYGHGFGSAGQIYLEGKLLTVTEWSENRIECMIPDGASSGELSVYTNMTHALGHLVVKRKEYSIHTEKTDYRMNFASELLLDFSITGFTDPIDFRMMDLPAGMSCEFLNGNTEVIPNATVECKLSGTDQLAPGEYHLSLRGVNAREVKYYPVTVTVHEKLIQRKTTLLDAQTGQSYLDQLIVSGGYPPYTCEILENSLPYGLLMDEAGKISGIPTVSGNYTVKVQISDNNGAEFQQEIALTVF